MSARLVIPWVCALALLVAGPVGAQTPTQAIGAEAAEAAPRRQPVPPQGFRTPEEGFAALASALRTGDERRLLRVLGERARRLIRSGDPVADRAQRDRFARAYDEKADIRLVTPHLAVLQVGMDGWPLPIPLVRNGNWWRFAARLGTQELVDRRIGRNELDTIQTLRAIVDAQRDYARTAGRQGALGGYAQRFFSVPGTQDGLYWPTQPGEPESPLGPMVAAASAGGYGGPARPGDAPQPFHGYLFRILTTQGPAAPGGATDYVVNGRMIGGFGVLAVPAQYGVSGIQTFMVSHAGTVYERNLGPETARIARGITAFDPGPGWERVPD